VKNNKPKIKVRFNLGRGPNYMKWKVKYGDGSSIYYDPKEVQLRMINCQLKNHKKTAEKIFYGGSKVVCAWILCENIDIITDNLSQSDILGDRISYNPKVQPNWLLDNDNVDNTFFECIKSVDYKLYVV
jgi:hypothetical protein